jgi:hypothetical protein
MAHLGFCFSVKTLRLSQNDDVLRVVLHISLFLLYLVSAGVTVSVGHHGCAEPIGASQWSWCVSDMQIKMVCVGGRSFPSRIMHFFFHENQVITEQIQWGLLSLYLFIPSLLSNYFSSFIISVSLSYYQCPMSYYPVRDCFTISSFLNAS